jgi:Zn-dependent protease
MSEEKIILNPPQETGEQVITRIGNTPVTRRGWTWFPLTQFLVWSLFTRQASRRIPENPAFLWSGEGFLKMLVFLGSEWCHNLAHLVASNLIGQPMDQFLVQFGMPRCIYHEINDIEVSPRQHVIRSLGGPLINLILLPVSGFFKRVTNPDSILGETANLAYQTNLFLSLVSLLPIPWIDGGPLLKWSLVNRGYSVAEADRTVKQANGPLALILGLFSSWSFGRKKILRGFVSGILGIVSLSVFAGWLKEEDLSF